MTTTSGDSDLREAMLRRSLLDQQQKGMANGSSSGTKTIRLEEPPISVSVDPAVFDDDTLVPCLLNRVLLDRLNADSARMKRVFLRCAVMLSANPCRQEEHGTNQKATPRIDCRISQQLGSRFVKWRQREIVVVVAQSFHKPRASERDLGVVASTN
jgi:hypothetical protein